MRVLLVEDDDGFARALVKLLDAHGHRVTLCCRGADALKAHHDAELVLLDLGLPDISGFEVLCRLRRISTVPVIVLTVRGDERSVVRALDCGAADFVPKSRAVRKDELLARMRAVTRAPVPGENSPSRVVQVGGMCVELVARTVEVAGQPVRLTTKEFEVLAVLVRHAGIPVNREQLMVEVWGYADLAVSHALSRALDVHIANLRAKLGRPDLIQTIRGFGYRFGEE